MDLYNETLEILRARKYIKADLILPTYICSIGAHMFNYVNKSKKILTDNDDIQDYRTHVFMVTIPGFGKTFLKNQFSSDYKGMLVNTSIPVGKVGSLTSAGFVGSVRTNSEGEKVVTKGVLQRKHDHILISDEFHNVTSGGRSSHSSNLLDDLLLALDAGEMNKDQSAGGIEYKTNATVWGATQTKRFDLTSGLIRRFAFVVYMPDYNDAIKLRDSRETSKNLQTDLTRFLEYKLAMKVRYTEIKNNLKSVEFDPSYYKWIRSFFGFHHEDMIYEKILLGYWMMKVKSIPENMVLTLNDEVKDIIKQQIKMRLEIQKGIKDPSIVEVLRQAKMLPKDDLIKFLLNFGVPEKGIERVLDVLIERNIVNDDDGILSLNEENI